jgi:hypothetical protein
MSSNNSIILEGVSLVKTEQTRKPYRKPQLEVLGDLRTLTLGGSPGLNDSGGSYLTRKPLGSMLQPGGFPPLPDGFPKPGDPPKP